MRTPAVESKSPVLYFQVPIPFKEFIGSCKQFLLQKQSELADCSEIKIEESSEASASFFEDSKDQIYLAQVVTNFTFKYYDGIDIFYVIYFFKIYLLTHYIVYLDGFRMIFYALLQVPLMNKEGEDKVQLPMLCADIQRVRASLAA